MTGRSGVSPAGLRVFAASFGAGEKNRFAAARDRDPSDRSDPFLPRPPATPAAAG
jgi:hypothetical protein